MKIFLLENCFYLVTANYKSDFLKRFEDLCSKHLRYFNTPHKKITINLKMEHWISWRLAIGKYEGNEVWDNVMTWLHRFHAGEIRSVVKVAPKARLATFVEDYIRRDMVALQLIATMFNVARSMLGQLWSVVEKTLLAMRPSLVALNEAWGRDLEVEVEEVEESEE